MTTKHPGKVAHRLQTGMGCPPEPLVQIALGPSRTNVPPELAEGLFQQVGTVDLPRSLLKALTDEMGEAHSDNILTPDLSDSLPHHVLVIDLASKMWWISYRSAKYGQ